MNTHPFKPWLLASAVVGSLGLAPYVHAEALPEVTGPGAIVGTLDIDFATRRNLDRSGKLADGSPAEGSKDRYTLALTVANTTEFSGSVERSPRLVSKLLQRDIQPAGLQYDLTLSVRNPSNLQQKRAVGKWVGAVPIDAQGVYLLDGGAASGSPLRMAIDSVGTAEGFTDTFAGRLVGRQPTRKSLVPLTLKRLVGKREVKIEAQKIDPMSFENVVLAAGPAKIYPRTTVNGRMVFDYETGNWYLDGLSFRYSLNGQDYEDRATGSIKWVEDANRAQNGKGRYEFNVRFNEDKVQPPTGEAAAFSQTLSDEDAFFAVDASVPALTGNAEFVDQLVPGKDAPVTSKISYNLAANRLTKQQIVNFFKLWLLAIGPTNDE